MDKPMFGQTPDLIDLISERHRQLRLYIESEWNAEHSYKLSSSDWNLIARIEQQNLPISTVTKKLGITRQAVHKLIKKLKDLEIVAVSEAPNNQRDKWIGLTPKGKNVYTTYVALKRRVETDIFNHLGRNEMEQLIHLLQKNWNLD